MVTEFIKRGQKMGYDEGGNLVYKIPLEQEAPVVEEVVAEEEATEEQQSSFVGGLFGK